MTAADIVKLADLAYTSGRCVPIQKTFVDCDDPRRCCGLTAAYLEDGGHLPANLKDDDYDSDDFRFEISEWLDHKGLDTSFEDGFISGYDGEQFFKCYDDDAEYIEGYEAGKSLREKWLPSSPVTKDE
jgi:hypothetical protein